MVTHGQVQQCEKSQLSDNNFSTKTFPDISQTPFGLGALGGVSGLSNLGMGSANFMEMQQQIQTGMMSNPDFMRQVMDSPLTQSLMSNPEILRGLIQSNPQMRQVNKRTWSWPRAFDRWLSPK